MYRDPLDKIKDNWDGYCLVYHVEGRDEDANVYEWVRMFGHLYTLPTPYASQLPGIALWMIRFICMTVRFWRGRVLGWDYVPFSEYPNMKDK